MTQAPAKLRVVKRSSKRSRRAQPKKHRPGRSKAQRRTIAGRPQKRLVRPQKRFTTSPKGKRKRHGARKSALDNRTLRVLRLMQHGESLSSATRKVRMKPATAKKRLGNLIHRKGPGQRWKPSKSDRFTALMNVLTPLGQITVPVRGSRERKLLGRYNAALGKWRRGESSAETTLARFEGQKVAGHPLITDPDTLAILEDADLLDFEELYSSLAGGA